MTPITLTLCDDDLAASKFHAAFQGVSLEHYIMRTVTIDQWKWHRDNGTTPFTAQHRPTQPSADFNQGH